MRLEAWINDKSARRFKPPKEGRREEGKHTEMNHSNSVSDVPSKVMTERPTRWQIHHRRVAGKDCGNGVAGNDEMGVFE